jgi:hypothetical protein
MFILPIALMAIALLSALAYVILGLAILKDSGKSLELISGRLGPALAGNTGTVRAIDREIESIKRSMARKEAWQKFFMSTCLLSILALLISTMLFVR